MPPFTSTGQCNLCGETFSKRAMTRHLTKCQGEHPLKKGKPRPTFHLLVEGQYIPEYWLHLEVPAAATFLTLDAFLRDVWLECCGHLSAFTVERARYELDTGGIDGMWLSIFGSPEPPQSMKARLDSALRPGLKFFHEYDFGTTTHLALKVVAEGESVLAKNAVRILARNHPPPIPCGKCNQLATDVCVECMDSPNGWLCATHAEKHKHQDMFLPVVNSPRVGQCGYTGPLEDLTHMIHLLREKAMPEQIQDMLAEYKKMIKIAVDVRRTTLAGGGIMHADCEALLLEDGSDQDDIWGANWHPADERIEFEAIINIRPRLDNRSMILQSQERRRAVEAVTRQILGNVR